MPGAPKAAELVAAGGPHLEGQQQLARQGIARLTGLTRTSVGELVADLVRDGLAEDVGRGPSTGGKQPTLVALKDDARTVITLRIVRPTNTCAP